MTEINEMPPDWQRNEFMGLNVANDRAVHQLLDNPKIFEDPLALRIIGAETEAKLRLSLGQFQKPSLRDFRAGVMIRNRFAEDELKQSIQRGVRQYVILGAGLDTFAYRNPFSFLRVFEVDHPATQVWKRSCLEKAAIPIPASLSYVSMDFEQQNLADVLGQSDFKNEELTFVSFIGVVRYLSREAFMSVLTSIASSMRSGSEVVFDFAPPPHLLDVLAGRVLPDRTGILDAPSSRFLPRRLWKLGYRAIADRMVKNNNFRPSYFELKPLTCDLGRVGFSHVQLFGPREMNVRYCKGRTDGLRIQNRMHLAKARV